MTREELKNLIRESIRENLEISNIDEQLEEIDEDAIELEQCLFIEETMFNNYIDSYILTEDYVDIEPDLLIEAKKEFYNNANNSKELRDKKHQLLQAALAKKDKVKEVAKKITAAVKAAVKKNPQLSKSEIKAIAKSVDGANELNETQLKVAIDAAGVAGLIGKANTSSDITVIDNAEKALINIKNSKESIVDDVSETLSGDVINPDGTKAKTAKSIADKLGPGFKAVGGKIISIYSGNEGGKKQAIAIAATASALVGSIAAAAIVNAKKKKKLKNESNKKEEK